jgi:hypothetical protein
VLFRSITIQNGDIGIWVTGNIVNSTIANRNFVNMSIAIDIEDITTAGNLSIINTTFNNCGIATGEVNGAVYFNTNKPAYMIANRFINTPDDGYDVQCGICTELSLQQNYYSNIASLNITTDNVIRNIVTPAGTFSCTPGTAGSQYPYANSTLYPNNGKFDGEDLVDFYPCTTLCAENWVRNTSSTYVCTDKTTEVLNIYNDANNCGTYFHLPAANGTMTTCSGIAGTMAKSKTVIYAGYALIAVFLIAIIGFGIYSIFAGGSVDFGSIVIGVVVVGIFVIFAIIIIYYLTNIMPT